MYDKAHEHISDTLDRLLLMHGVSSAAVRHTGETTVRTQDMVLPEETVRSMLATTLDVLALAPDDIATIRAIVSDRAIHCQRSGAWSVAVVAPVGHPVGKSLQRSMRRALALLRKGEVSP